MAYPIPTGAIVAASWIGNCLGQRTLTTMHFRMTNPTDLPDGQAALNVLAAAIQGTGGLQAKLMAPMASNVEVLALRLQWIHPVRYIFEQYVTVERRGVVADRHNRGTLHLWGVPQDGFTGGLVSSTYTTAAGPFVGAQHVDIATVAQGRYIPIIFNRNAPDNSPEIESALQQGTIRIMRRRTVGVGE
jgi:hypothetical protein